MSKTSVHATFDGAVARITFSTEGSLNVLSSDVLRSFGNAIRSVRDHSAVRTAIVQAEGKVFLAGADIKEMAGFTRDQAREYAKLGQEVLNALAFLPSVTIAALQGAALGGGLEVALACDFRLAVKSAKLGLPEVTLGLIPGWSGIPRLTKLIGPARAKRLFLSGNPMSAEESLAWGLVDEVVNSPEDLAARVTAFVGELAKAGPVAVGLAKRAARDGDDVSAFVDCFAGDEPKEGMTAFTEKRPAKWIERSY
jgi:enoyl-CoA hydratase